MHVLLEMGFRELDYSLNGGLDYPLTGGLRNLKLCLNWEF